jgi:hypothetical protein
MCTYSVFPRPVLSDCIYPLQHTKTVCGRQVFILFQSAFALHRSPCNHKRYLIPVHPSTGLPSPTAGTRDTSHVGGHDPAKLPYFLSSRRCFRRQIYIRCGLLWQNPHPKKHHRFIAEPLFHHACLVFCIHVLLPTIASFWNAEHMLCTHFSVFGLPDLRSASVTVAGISSASHAALLLIPHAGLIMCVSVSMVMCNDYYNIIIMQH